jgi:predicted house-cleaning noncanonical NTP pyrophosphatase (MazG superfamily)
MSKTRTFRLNKLVRDKIVRYHLEMGGDVRYKTLSGKKLTDALLKKLIEEATELKTTNLSVGELADLQELVDALAEHLGTATSSLSRRQTEKRKQNGAFKEGHFIDTVTLPADNKWAKYYAADPKRFPEIKR